MTDHPSTYKAVKTHSDGIDWDDRATLHRKDDGQGVLDAMKALNRGSLREMVALVAAMPEQSRADYVIQKSGDHMLDTGEIMALAKQMPTDAKPE